MVKFKFLPLEKIVVTSPYGLRNLTVNGINYWWHNGIDLYANLQTPVYAVDDGTVMAAKYDGEGYGYYIALNHGKFGTLYAHLLNNVVTQGKTVKAGDLIGYSGDTGTTTGPHLHLELRICTYDNFWDRASCDRSVFMRTVDPMLFIEEYQESAKALTLETAISIVKTKAGLEDKTMDYIANDYKYGNDLITKLAKALL
ncbi:MAG: M23 family metallopeptidase [Sedimentibacter sp.]|uniref:M23 family metallopeptidase n=1 Tax=Sedimentibacter sp. TaxID=1960295 RepID=UPI002981B992|nr:M23 family metallopeptidase [Sedimentibacter sp.]MDW5299402.1 M23 family metallopeptidase [Sedimentibacter sp.]